MPVFYIRPSAVKNPGHFLIRKNWGAGVSLPRRFSDNGHKKRVFLTGNRTKIIKNSTRFPEGRDCQSRGPGLLYLLLPPLFPATQRCIMVTVME
jgi:hypothetical protein